MINEQAINFEELSKEDLNSVNGGWALSNVIKFVLFVSDVGDMAQGFKEGWHDAEKFWG